MPDLSREFKLNKSRLQAEETEKMKAFTILAALALSTPVFADQFSMGKAAGTVYFCTTGAGQPIQVSTSDANCGSTGGTVSGSGFFQDDNSNPLTGIEPFTFTLPTQIDNLVGALFMSITMPAWHPMTFGSGSNLITGTVTWAMVKDHTETPQLIGTFHTLTNANTGQLLTDFPVGVDAPVDYTINLGTAPQLDALWAGTTLRTQGTFSSGEVTATPETSSILLMGTGMLLAGTVIRLRRRKQAQV